MLYQLFQNNAHIFNYYESISKCDYCLNRPLFWLQQAIARTANQDFNLAKHHFETAYAFAREQSFDTFQIDNHYAHFLLKVALSASNVDNRSPFEIFSEAHAKLSKRRRGDEHYYYIYKVASDYLPFWKKFSKTFSLEQKVHFKNACEEIISMADKYLGLNTASEFNMVQATRKDLDIICHS